MDKDRAKEMFEDGATIMWELAKLLRVGARILTAVAKELAYEWSNGHEMPPQPRSQRSGGQVPHQRKTQQERAERLGEAMGFRPPAKWDPDENETDQTHLLDEEDDREW